MKQLILIFFISRFLTACADVTPTNPADTIYLGGNIITINDDQPIVEALAIKDGKIVALGQRAEIENTNKGVDTKVVDLNGKTLLPGFLDAHSHYINSLMVANQAQVYAPPSGPGKDIPSIIATIKKIRCRARHKRW
jgi:hypothetical protein